MKISFLGATRTVTGSFFVIDTEKTRFAVDCGLFQGPKEIKERNYKEFVVDPASIDFLILTHAHIDHIGLVPKLCKHGFRGPIFCSKPTQELASILLPDSAYIQECEVERKNRKLKRAGKLLIEPIYTVDDALESLKQFRYLQQDEIVELAPAVKIRLRDAGHILGSTIIEMWVEENGKALKLVLTGDLGNSNQPIIKDPTIIEDADYIIMESTYGNRFHKGIHNRLEQLNQVIKDSMAKGGNLIIPAFAVERTQDLLYDLNQLYKNGELDPSIDIYIDSPLAIAATEIFEKHIEYYDYEASQILANGDHPLRLPNLKVALSQEESVRLNRVQGNTIIISASGMCDAGRIKHHLKHNLWRPECTILFVGYQAEGTLGRRIVDGEKLVRIHGEQVAVKADIRSIEAYSAHADQAGLINWLKHFITAPKGIFLVHGEEQGQQVLAELIRNEIRVPVHIPDWMDEFILTPSDRVQPKTELMGDEISKALLAEQMYLELRTSLHNLFKEKWLANDYDELIEKMKKIQTAIH
ncbi:MAG TPA: MBL fold metallo-hydrolase [Syntrophomonadaceae bacterium]|nr:MBL fold metallo-hydrolase [Syntrophomonadaceae bacterium]HQE23421.1 MBL fold metallo-hydrolase [Syntrophomonadaceae bacterium]